MFISPNKKADCSAQSEDLFGGMDDHVSSESIVTLDNTTHDESSELSIVSNKTPTKKRKKKIQIGSPAKKSAVLDVCVMLV